MQNVWLRLCLVLPGNQLKTLQPEVRTHQSTAGYVYNGIDNLNNWNTLFVQWCASLSIKITKCDVSTINYKRTKHENKTSCFQGMPQNVSQKTHSCTPVYHLSAKMRNLTVLRVVNSEIFYASHRTYNWQLLSEQYSVFKRRFSF